jgi:hypothetical protein
VDGDDLRHPCPGARVCIRPVPAQWGCQPRERRNARSSPRRTRGRKQRKEKCGEGEADRWGPCGYDRVINRLRWAEEKGQTGCDSRRWFLATSTAGRKARSSLARSNSLVSSSARLGSLGNLNQAKLRFQLAMITSRARAGSRAAREP